MHQNRFKQVEHYEPAIKWPVVNPSRILDIAQSAGAGRKPAHLRILRRLIEASPERAEEMQLTPDEWLDYFYRDDDLLCIGEDKFATAIKPRAKWRGKLYWSRFISPNPFQYAAFGRKNENVSERSYLLTEMDMKLEDKGGKTVLGYLTRTSDLNPFDIQAAVLLHLQSLGIVPLLPVVFSGNKSLHALWKADWSEEVNLKFIQTAREIGVDKAGWVRSQFCRICNPAQDQPLFYLDRP